MILLHSEFLKLYNIHILGNLYIVGISLIAMELMFSEYIILLGQYLTLISDVISWIEEEHEFMSDKFIVFYPQDIEILTAVQIAESGNGIKISDEVTFRLNPNILRTKNDKRVL